MKGIVGKKVEKIRLMTGREMDAEGWMQPSVVIVLEGGVKLYCSRDPEGNGPGQLYASKGKDRFLLGIKG